MVDEQEPEHRDSAGIDHRSRIERLFVDHNDNLLRFLRARLGSAHEASEVAQEAYVRLLSLDAPSTVGYLRAFLFRTAANIAIDRRRRDEVHGRAVELPQFSESSDFRTPERRVSDEQTLLRLQRLIEALPRKCQLAFISYEIEGQDIQTIAAKMHLTEASVRKYVTKAWLHCRAHLDLEAAANEKR